jgi:hypothetical protein
MNNQRVVPDAIQEERDFNGAKEHLPSRFAFALMIPDFL